MALPLAPVPDIKGQATWVPFDVSGILFDYTKLADMPSTLYEDGDGYHEELTEDDGWHVERTFKCNWSDANAAMQWIMGGSFLLQFPLLTSQILGPNGRLPNGDLPTVSEGGGGVVATPIAAVLSRVTPLQDWYRPYLYASSVELVEGRGVALQDPGLMLPGGIGLFAESVVNVGVGPAPSFQRAGSNFLSKELGDVFPLPFSESNRQRLPGLVFAELRGPSNLLPDGTLSGDWADGVAVLRVSYRGRPYIIRNDVQNALYMQGELGRYVERKPQYAIQGVPLQKLATSGPEKLLYVGTNLEVPEPGTLLMPTVSWEYRWIDVPFYPTAIASCVGKVNALPFDGVNGWPLFPAQTLLCQAPTIVPKRNAFGAMCFDVTWRLDENPRGWNAFPIAGGGFALASYGGVDPRLDPSKLVFQPSDFSLLFQPGLTLPFG